MKGFTKGLVIIVIIVHCLFFLLEAILWMRPAVYTILITLLNNPVKLEYPLQALVLRNLFINQGFYNFFLVCAGLAGLYLIAKGKQAAGYTLLLFMCFAGAGAGIVLAFSTTAYLLAFLQGVPAAVAFLRLYALSRHVIS